MGRAVAPRPATLDGSGVKCCGWFHMAAPTRPIGKIFKHQSERLDMVAEDTAKISYIERLKEDLMIFRLVPDEVPVPEYEAGQYTILGMPNPNENNKVVRRAYSIASHPENREYLELYVRWVRNPLPGRLTTQIFSAEIGTPMTWMKPRGHDLTINEELHNGEKDERRIVCLGGGTGLAPFISIALHLRDTGDKREVVVLHGASYTDELGYRELLEGLEKESQDRGTDKWNFKYRPTISRPKENPGWDGHTGRVEGLLKPNSDGKMPLEEILGDEITRENTMFYICGWQGTIDGALSVLEPRGFVTNRNKRDDGSFEVKFESYG